MDDFAPMTKFDRAVPMMHTDVREFKDRYEMGLELPGCRKEDIQADLNNGYLTITASHNENNDEKDKEGKYIRRERYSGKCTRTFYVGEDVRQEDIKAGFENGILKVTIPKVEAKPEVEESKHIPIE
jgi:HSP20 family molecular chaperone IbpA